MKDIFEYARDGETDQVIKLLDEVADLNETNDHGDTALKLAAESGRETAVAKRSII